MKPKNRQMLAIFKQKLTWKNAGHSAVIILGFLLSPLSWWNDIFINIPLAYAFAVPFSLFNEKFFLPAFISGYLLTNVLGLLLMHHGLRKMFNTRKKQKELVKDLIIAFLYTIIIVALVLLGVLKQPQAYMHE